MAENAEQISDTLVLDYIKKKDPTLGMKISKKWNAPELPPGSPDVKEVVAHFLKTNKKRRESLELLTPAKKSKSEKSTPKANGVANGTAKSGKFNGHAKGSESSSEESSDDEEAKPVAATKTPSKSPKVVRPTAPVQQDSSEESSSEEEEKPAAKKVVTPKTTPKQAPKKESSSEEDSSDDDEPPKKAQVQTPKVVVKVVAKKESSSSEEDSSEEEPPKKPTKSVKVTKPVSKKVSSSDDSSDDEEPPKPKVTPKQTPKVQPKPAAKESSDDSDSSDESEAETKKKAPAKKVVPAKAPVKAASSSEEESSDEEEAKKPVAKKVPAKPVAKKESSDEDDSSDEGEPPKKVIKKQTKKESSSSDESSSDDEEEAKPVVPAAGEKRKRESEGGAQFGKQQKFIKADAALDGDSAESESCELFVNRIGSSMTDDQLYEHFKQFGSIERTKVVTDRDTGESRGFAFVTFSSPAEAKAALSQGFSHMIDGTECQVRLAEGKPMAGGQQKFGGNNSSGNNSFGAGDAGESRELFVNRLDYSFTDDHLFEYFKQFGSVERAKVATDRETGDSRGFAFITFATPEDAKAAVAKGQTHSIEGSEFCIRLAEPKGNDGGRQQFAAPQSTQRRKSEPFRRVREEEVVVDPKFTNAFTAKRGAEDDWGFRAHRDLIKTRGKGFRHEKNKKKKGSYSGGTISTAVTSILFD